jgi:type I restriction enzyme S subunit
MGQRASEANSYVGYKKVSPGQLISNKMQGWNGVFGISPFEGITSPDYAIYEFIDSTEPRFIEYTARTQLYAAEFHCRSKGIGTGFLRLNPAEFLSTPFWLPDHKTQKAIADFLDPETARIDQLVEKKKWLVGLVDEKRSALITAAVTGQLDADGKYAEGRDCRAPEGGGGVTFWPKTCHQILRPLKHTCWINPDTLPETTDPEFEFEYIDIGNVALESGIIGREKMTFGNAPSRARKPVRPDDVIVSTVRTYLKAVASVPPDSSRWVVSTGFAVLRRRSNIHPRYLYRVVQSNPFVESVVAVSTGVSYPAINPSTLGRIPVPVPDLETQKRIVDFLDRETAQFDALKTKTRESIDHLREFRATLITAAVTGQIDVETWSKRGETDQRLGKIEEEMAARPTEHMEARA